MTAAERVLLYAGAAAGVAAVATASLPVGLAACGLVGAGIWLQLRS